MALTGVTRPGHIQLRVLDLAESVRFYTDVMGLVETGRDSQGRVYFKTYEERDHSSFIIREADEAGMDFIGFKVLNEATLDQLEKNLQDYGVTTRRLPAGDLLETGEHVRRHFLITRHLADYLQILRLHAGRRRKDIR